jgi:hypothetical protein
MPFRPRRCSSSASPGDINLPICLVLTTLWMLPILVLTSPLAALARDTASILPMTLGKEYNGSLTPSPSNPHGEVCYQLAVKPNTRITLNVKTSGVGIVKFALYDKARSLRFFHNHVNNKLQSTGDAPTDGRFSFPAIEDASQLCLTTSNSHRSQHYDLSVTGKPIRKAKSRLKLRSVASNPVMAPILKPPADIPTFTPPIPIAATITTVELPPSGKPYCYVGTWQIRDLSSYWLPTIQSFTQAQIADRQMLGYAKVILTRDGNAKFEAIDLEQQYTLKSKETGAKIDNIGVNLAGNSTAKFQLNQDGTIAFNSQDYRRLTARLNLTDSLKLTGDRLFTFFGDRDLPAINSSYKCLDRDNMTLKVPAPNGQKLISVSLRRVN